MKELNKFSAALTNQSKFRGDVLKKITRMAALDAGVLNVRDFGLDDIDREILPAMGDFEKTSDFINEYLKLRREKS